MNHNSLRLWFTTAACCLVIGACAYRGADDPVSRKFSWFSYLNGDDIRQACGDGASDQYRFVYNAINVEQIRTYDLRINAGPKGHLLSVRVIGPTDLSSFGVSQPGDLLNPWRGDSADVWLRDRDLARLDQAMSVDGVFAEAPHGLRFHSYDFYWLVVGCRSGSEFFDVVRWPDERFVGASYPQLLTSWDLTGIAVNSPRQADLRLVYPDKPEESVDNYQLRVGENGLIGVLGLF